DAAKDAIVEQAPAAAGEAAAGVAAVTTPLIPFAHILGIAVFTVIFGISLGYLIAKRMGTPSFLE
ncbi:hypothetical protein KA005_30490, partial [bacterium]|nr:hypothetical protein [bacterium]